MKVFPLKTHTTPWILTDQNLVSALYATISQSILPYILNLNTCAEIWETVEKQLQFTNRARIFQLKNELHNLSMNQYLLDIKIKVDLIAASSSAISTEDIIFYTLNRSPHSMHWRNNSKQQNSSQKLGVPMALVANNFEWGRPSSNSNYCGHFNSRKGRGRHNGIEC